MAIVVMSVPFLLDRICIIFKVVDIEDVRSVLSIFLGVACVDSLLTALCSGSVRKAPRQLLPWLLLDLGFFCCIEKICEFHEAASFVVRNGAGRNRSRRPSWFKACN